MFKIELQWKEFNVDLRAVDTNLRGLYGNYVGNQASACLELWFIEEPSEEDKVAIETYWNSIESDSSEVLSYKSSEQIQADIEAKKVSGKAKLIALGLSEEEASALLG